MWGYAPVSEGEARTTSDGAGPLRVAYVMSRFPKLTETFILFEMIAVERQGVAVELFPLLRERTSTIHPEASALVDRARFLPFLSWSIVKSQLWFLRHRPRRYMRTIWAIVRGTWRSPNFLLGGLGILPKVAHAARLMRALGVDHVHCHFANHPAMAGWIIHRLVGLPFSFTAHGSDLHVDRRMLCEKVSRARFVVAISDDNRRVIEHECPTAVAGRVQVIHCGVDTSVFRPASVANAGGLAGVGEGDGALEILAIGTLHEVKGQAVLVDACRELTARGVAIRARFVGDGPDRTVLAERIAAAGLDGRVQLLGTRTRGEIADLLAVTDVLVAPSVPTRSGKREGIPVVLMEAMASGVPVVASRLSGIPEIVRDGENGRLFPPGDASALADALVELATDPALRDRLGRAARATAVRDFDVEANAARLVDRIRAAA
jgi:colanic acid/amylovoran biosynthesis glycosyltransferase